MLHSSMSKFIPKAPCIENNVQKFFTRKQMTKLKPLLMLSLNRYVNIFMWS